MDTPSIPRPIEMIWLPRKTDSRIVDHITAWLAGQNMLLEKGEANGQTWFKVQTKDDQQAQRFIVAWQEIVGRIMGKRIVLN